MKLGPIEFYVYPTSSNTKLSWTDYTGDAFYGEGRRFRYELIILGQVLNLQWWRKK